MHVLNDPHIKRQAKMLYCNLPVDELKWLLKAGDGRIFESCHNYLENMSTSHTLHIGSTLDVRTHACRVLVYGITANGACLHLLVPPLSAASLVPSLVPRPVRG